MFKFPVIELVDRYLIAKLKYQKLGNNKEELDFYTDQMKLIELDLIEEELQQLFEVHSQVWDVENTIKQGQVDKIDLAEIGRRALLSRDLLKERYVIKNSIADKLKDPVREYKDWSK